MAEITLSETDEYFFQARGVEDQDSIKKYYWVAR